MKKTGILFAAFLFILGSLQAQDATFLNSNQSLVYLNPSFAGSNGGVRNQLSYQNEWPEFWWNPVTIFNSFDAYIKPLNGGVAFSYFNENLGHGVFKRSAYSATYAQHLLLSDKLKIVPSVQFTYGENAANYDNPNNWFYRNPQGTDPRPKKSYFGVSGGILLNYKKNFYAGLSVFNINRPDGGLYGSQQFYRTILHASYTHHLGDKHLIQFLARHISQSVAANTDLAINTVLFKHLIAGAVWTVDNTGGVNAGYRNDYFVITAGYFMYLSRLSVSSVNSIELHASFNLRNKELRKSLTNFETW